MTREIMRMTHQRQIILEELKKLDTHPTADELYQIVKKRLPKISLGTIYRNLETLSGIGSIQKIDTAGTKKRFDGNTEDHYHIRCISCDAVHDLKTESPLEITRLFDDDGGFRVVGCRLELLGICPACLKRNGPSGKTN